jgi:hypothetical protein
MKVAILFPNGNVHLTTYADLSAAVRAITIIFSEGKKKVYMQYLPEGYMLMTHQEHDHDQMNKSVLRYGLHGIRGTAALLHPSKDVTGTIDETYTLYDLFMSPLDMPLVKAVIRPFNYRAKARAKQYRWWIKNTADDPSDSK